MIVTPRYTEVLCNLMEDQKAKAKIEEALSSYPLYKSTSKREFGIPNIIPTREELNKKIINNFKYREIGFETPGRFIEELKIAMEEIMPKYNQLYFSADQDYNIIYNVDYKKTISRELEGNNTNNSEGLSSSTNDSLTNG